MKPIFRVDSKIRGSKEATVPDLTSTKHRQSKSMGVPITYIKTPTNTKHRPRLSNCYLSETCKSKSSKIITSPTNPFILSNSNSRLIKIPKSTTLEDRVMWKTQSLPLNPEKVLKIFKHYLTPFEEIEILNVEKVWFIGIGAHKVKTGVKNNGFDEDSGDYRVIIGDHLVYRYEVMAPLGSGTFGTVVKVFDHKLKKEFAVKIIKNKPRFNQIALEEIEVLQYLRGKDANNSFKIVHLLESFYFRNHTCLKFDLLGMSLYQYIKLNSFQGFSPVIIRKIATQLLNCLKSLETSGIIHCDLKPENVLFQDSATLDLKLIDFGSAAFSHKRMYNYIQSRYYRSPEIILGLEYSSKIDMWSFGCLLGELFIGRPIFPGESESDQLSLIMEVFGPPPVHMIKNANRQKLYFHDDLKVKLYTNSKGKTRLPASRGLNEVLKSAESSFVDFIQKCLEWDPNKRLSAEQALTHEWIEGASRSKHMKTQSHAVFSFSKLLGRSDLKLF